jgi:hypothetical protein
MVHIIQKVNWVVTTWTLAGTCFLLSVLIDLEEKKQQKLKYEYLQEEFIITRSKYFNLLDSNRSLTRKYSRLKTKTQTQHIIQDQKNQDNLVIQY